MMKKFTVQNPLDDLTCTFCKMMEGTEVEDVEKAEGVPFAECENMDNEVKCRCYVAEERGTTMKNPTQKQATIDIVFDKDLPVGILPDAKQRGERIQAGTAIIVLYDDVVVKISKVIATVYIRRFDLPIITVEGK